MPHHPTPPPVADDRTMLEHLRLRFEEHAETDRRELAAVRTEQAEQRQETRALTRKQTGLLATLTAIIVAIAHVVSAYFGR